MHFHRGLFLVLQYKKQRGCKHREKQRHKKETQGNVRDIFRDNSPFKQGKKKEKNAESSQVAHGETVTGNPADTAFRSNFGKIRIIKNQTAFKSGICCNKKKGSNKHIPRTGKPEQSGSNNRHQCKHQKKPLSSAGKISGGPENRRYQCNNKH